MTSEQNKKLPRVAPKQVIGIKRRPNARDLVERDNLQGLPDPDAEVVLRRAVLNTEQAALRAQQSIIDMNPASNVRGSRPIVLIPPPPPPPAPESEPDSDEDQKAIEDATIGKVRGIHMDNVTDARPRRVRPPPSAPAPTKKAKIVKKRGRPAGKTKGNSKKRSGVVQPAPFLSYMLPGTVREMSVAEAALAITNEEMGTSVTMEDVEDVGELEALLESDPGEEFPWTVGFRHGEEGAKGGRESIYKEGEEDRRTLTVAEAALVLTNMREGTSVTMEDLRTARDLVGLWDCEDRYVWTVGEFWG